jgi:hypothetical protein
MNEKTIDQFNKMFAQNLKEAQIQRDIEATYQLLVKDNERRIARGLPPFEPSYELAEKIVRK